jgi:hypothetical protein
MRIKSLFLISMVLIFFASCTKDIKQPTVITQNNTVKFSTDIYPIFTTKGCVDCHDATASSGNLSLTGTASEVRGKLITRGAVVPGNSANSPLYTKFANGGVHNGNSFTTTQLTNVKSWIDLGALDN